MSDQMQDYEVTLETKKAKLRTRRRALAAGATDSSVSAKQRTTVEYLSSLRASLDPADVGPALSELFLFAVRNRNVGLLRLMLPYVLGAPEENQNQNHNALDMLISAMRSEPALPAPVTIDGETSFSVPEELSQEE